MPSINEFKKTNECNLSEALKCRILKHNLLARKMQFSDVFLREAWLTDGPKCCALIHHCIYPRALPPMAVPSQWLTMAGIQGETQDCFVFGSPTLPSWLCQNFRRTTLQFKTLSTFLLPISPSQASGMLFWQLSLYRPAPDTFVLTDIFPVNHLHI